MQMRSRGIAVAALFSLLCALSAVGCYLRSRQLKSEARLLAQLNHPNIVRVWDFEDDPTLPYLVMEFVDGPSLEELILRTLAAFNVRGERREDRVGVWVKRPDKGLEHEDKIAAIGVRLKRWVSFHGIAINVEPELSHFAGIVPCGVADPRYGVTSLVDLGQLVTLVDVDVALRRAFEELFGPTSALLPEAAA